jgi:hypothetical protein
MGSAAAPAGASRRRASAATIDGSVVAVARTIAAIFVCLGATGTRSAAQGSVSLSAGIASIRYADSLSVVAATIGPTLRFDSDRLSLAATGMGSRVTAPNGPSAGIAQGAFAGSLFVPTAGPVDVEVLAGGGMSAHQDHTRTGQFRSGARVHFMRAAKGIWAGAALGQTWDGAAWRSVHTGDAGAWIRSGAAMITAAATPTSVSLSTGSAIRYADLELAARWTAGRVELGGSVGTRAGDAAKVTPRDERTWGSATATIRVGGPFSLVASAGSYPVDFVQGFPGGRYVSLALGVIPRPAPRRTPSSWNEGDDVVHRARGVTGFAVERAPAGLRRVRVRAPDAASVQLAGDFSAWQPVAMHRAGAGWWEADVRMPAGRQEIAVRADQGAWAAPPGVLVVTDELGGTSGLVVVP